MVSKGTRLGCRIPSLVSLASINALGECPGNPRPSVTHCTWAVEIYSSNVVGYTRINLGTGLTLVGNPFQEIGGETTAKSIQNLVKGEGLIDWTDTYQFFNKDLQAWMETYYYTDFDGVIDGLTGEPGEKDIELGEGFFVQTGSEGASVIFSGEVPSISSKSVSVVPGLTLVANPFLKNIDISTQASSEGLLDWTDCYLFFDAEQQAWMSTYYYTDFDGIIDGLSGEPVEELVLPVGGAFFIYHEGEGATFTLSSASAE